MIATRGSRDGDLPRGGSSTQLPMAIPTFLSQESTTKDDTGLADEVIACCGSCGRRPTRRMEAQEQPEVLSVDQAVKIALANNRTLKIVSLNLDVHTEKLAADKTKRLPSFSTYVFGSQLLTPISYTVPPGTFGYYSATGPIPASNSYITDPRPPHGPCDGQRVATLVVPLPHQSLCEGTGALARTG